MAIGAIITFSAFPGATAQTTITCPGGRVYTCAVGAVITGVPDFDAQFLAANGWVLAARGGTFTTALRPTTLPNGQPLPVGWEILDSTLTYVVFWNGKNWINPATGGSV